MESDGNGFPLIPALPGIPDSREALRSAFAYDRAGMRSIFVVTMLALLFACGGEDREQQEAAAIAKAEAAAKELATQLGAKLKHALGEGGPAEAIKVCSESAQQMSTEIGEKHGVSLRRTALRVRNPNNAPDEWDFKATSHDMPRHTDGPKHHDEHHQGRNAGLCIVRFDPQPGHERQRNDRQYDARSQQGGHGLLETWPLPIGNKKKSEKTKHQGNIKRDLGQ